MTQSPRQADHPVEAQFLDRWSPRAFSGEAMPPEALMRCFEAARWAPSSYNSQPWRFVYAHRDGAHWQRFLDLLGEFNRSWAKDAAVLVVLASRTVMRPPGRDEDVPSHSHSLDAGAAWENFALQATLLGWHTHGMVGFDRDRARAELHIPADCRVEQCFAVGRIGDPASLPEAMRAREAPSSRDPLSATVFEGSMAR